MSIRNLLLGALVLGSATPVLAQQRISEGAHLRVQVEQPNLASASTYEGTLVYSPSGFALHATDPAADGGVIAVPRSGVSKIEMYRSRDRMRSARNGAGFMGFVGASLGLIAGPIIAAQMLDQPFTPIVAKSTAAGLGAGLALGGIGGALFASDNWQRYTVPSDWR
jgi:hypothetical protein